MRFTAIFVCLLIVFSAVFFGANKSTPAVSAAFSSQPVQAQPVEVVQKIAKPKMVMKPKLVEVKPGDSLLKIAKQNKTTQSRLFFANKVIKNPNIIYPGDKLRIPRPDEKLKARPMPVIAPAVAYPKSIASGSRTVAVSTVASKVDGGVWDRLAGCESGGNWSINTGNGFYGGLQFTLSSWQGVGGSGYPHQASKSEQIARAEILKSRQGWGAWPACSQMLGLL